VVFSRYFTIIIIIITTTITMMMMMMMMMMITTTIIITIILFTLNHNSIRLLILNTILNITLCNHNNFIIYITITPPPRYVD